MRTHNVCQLRRELAGFCSAQASCCLKFTEGGLPLQIKAMERSARYTGCLLICFNTFSSCCDALRH